MTFNSWDTLVGRQICQGRVYQDKNDIFRYYRLYYSVMKQLQMDMFRQVCL